MSKPEKIIIFDTTLRDGEQSPGAAMNSEEKLLIAEALDRLGVDVIEAGFARSSKGDFEAIQEIARTVKHATVCSLARAKNDDIEAAAEAIKPARRGRIHTFLSTSPLHMKYKLKMEPEQVLDTIRSSVSHARRFTDDVEWSAEDGTRTESDFLCRAVEAAIKAGATTINIPDTVGYTVPDEYYRIIRNLKERVPNIDKAVLSSHCHNDLGLAVANSLAGINAGIRQVECTINGLGERAGNAALEEIVMALRVRNNILPFYTDIKSENITKTSRLVSQITGFIVQKNKAIVGANAFAHESGIHQHGMLAHAGTYEIMTPESVGLTKNNLKLGKLSGRSALKTKLSDLGFDLTEEELDRVFEKFKELADKKRDIYDEDLAALVDPLIFRSNSGIALLDIKVESGNHSKPIAKLELDVDGEHVSVESGGVGIIDAAFNAIKKLIPHDEKLELYQVQAITEGTDSQADVTVRLVGEDTISNGHGSDMDVLVASVLAYINALNNKRTLQSRMVAEKSQALA